MAAKRRPGAPADLEEVRPSRFIIHNPAASSTLRGEGERDGDRFLLTSWRREGLLARLRAKSFVVLTLADQIAALPALPPTAPPGPPIVRPLAANERVSYFAARPLGWQPAPPAPDNPQAVSLCEGWAIRRRKGRGPGAYYRLLRGTLQPLAEADALRHGLAQVALTGAQPIIVTPTEGGYMLPDLPLPPEHRTLLGRFSERQPNGTFLAPADLPLAAALLARLGLSLQTEK